MGKEKETGLLSSTTPSDQMPITNKWENLKSVYPPCRNGYNCWRLMLTLFFFWWSLFQWPGRSWDDPIRVFTIGLGNDGHFLCVTSSGNVWATLVGVSSLFPCFSGLAKPSGYWDNKCVEMELLGCRGPPIPKLHVPHCKGEVMGELESVEFWDSQGFCSFKKGRDDSLDSF